MARPPAQDREDFGPWLALAGLGTLVAAAVFAGDGAGDGSVPWLGAGALTLALAGATAAFLGAIPRPDPSPVGGISLALLGGFVLWSGASVLWSSAPDRSWDYFNRSLVYLGFAAAGLLVGTVVRRACTRAAGGLTLVVAAALVVALAGKVFPALYPDGARMARLRAPLEFWNALALLFALAVPLALWLGTGRRRSVRVPGAVLLFGLVVGILLTYSRSGLLAGVAGAALWLAVTPHRTNSAAVLLAGGVPGIAVALWAFEQPGVASDRQEYATRVADGAELGIALVLGAAASAGLAFAFGRLDPGALRSAGDRLRRLAPILAAGVLAAALAALAANADVTTSWLEKQADEFANPPTDLVTQDPGRLTSVSSNNRWSWWREAWESFGAEPVLGTGAGSFETTHRHLRNDALSVTEPHSVPLQFMSETGIIGALLSGGALAAGLVAVVGSVRRSHGPERAGATAVAVGLAVYVLHSFVDWDWDFLATTAPVFAVFGVLLAAGRAPRSAPRRTLLGLIPLLLLAALLFSLVSPWLAERRVDSAYAALGRGKPAEALDAAEDGRALNPVAIEPLVAQSVVQTAVGDLDAARRSLLRAVELQPENPDAWYELGYFELEVAGRPQTAVAALERAFALDRFGPAGALLERARAAAR